VSDTAEAAWGACYYTWPEAPDLSADAAEVYAAEVYAAEVYAAEAADEIGTWNAIGPSWIHPWEEQTLE
jgi:hypothetical protein